MSSSAIDCCDAEEWNPEKVAIDLWNAGLEARPENPSKRRSRASEGRRASRGRGKGGECHIPAAEMCDECDIEFSFMNVHNRVAHERLAEINCAYCGLPFDRNADLFSHLDCHQDRQLYCCICLEKFDCDDALADHLDGHRELHVLSCCSCRRTFTSKTSQLAHECVDISGPYMAPVSLATEVASGRMDPNVPLPSSAEGSVAAIQPDTDGSLCEKTIIENLCPQTVKYDAKGILTQTESQRLVPTPGVKLEIIDTMTSPSTVCKFEFDGGQEADTGSEAVNNSVDVPAVTQQRKRISFNERTEIWQWELKVKSFGDLQEGEEVVPVDVEIGPGTEETPPPVKPGKRPSKSTSGRPKKKGRKAKKSAKASPIGECDPETNAAVEANGSHEPKDGAEKETKYGNRFKNKDKLEALYGKGFHYQQCVKIDGRYHCPDETCSDNNHRGYATEKMIRNHIRLQHMVDECYRCHECDRPFAVKSKLSEHLLTHSGGRPHKCKECGASFKTEIILKAHVMTHSCPWQCYHCEAAFGRKNTLKEHMRETHCRICDVYFHCNTTFHRHEEEVKHVYSCTQCSKSTNTMARFFYHIRTVHYNETTLIDGKYVCDLCKRKFISRCNATRHVRRAHIIREEKVTARKTRRRAKIYSCSLCDFQPYIQDRVLDY